MNTDSKLMDMLTGYAAAHQHPFNVFMHMVGIPTIMFGALIPMTWLTFDVAGVSFSLAHIVMAGFFAFYLTLDVLFAVVFLIVAFLITLLATQVGQAPLAVSGSVAALTFFGGYAGQFIGHYVERSMPVLVKHPIQANLAAPFFTVVELFKITGLRPELFNAVQAQIARQREEEAAAGA
ncbi:MAG: Mpo1-like protein [Pseudomonadota bacterium]